MAAQVQAVSRCRAVRAFLETPVPDPRGTSTPESLADDGQAFELKTESGGGVFVLRQQGHQIWVKAAAGKGADDLTELGLELIEETARQAGCSEVAFQTCRPGLVRKAEARGYVIAGLIMKRTVA